MEEIKQEENKKINIDEFKKIDLKLGRILSAEKVPDTDKLLLLSVDLGPYFVEASQDKEETQDIRQIVSGIAMYFPNIEELVGKTCMFVANLEPRIIRGLESNGMILALSTSDGKFSLLEPNKEIPIGTSAK